MMLKYKLLLIISIITFILSIKSFATIENGEYGSFHKQRPPIVQKTIDELFNRLSKRPKSLWSINGESKYKICGIDDEKLMLYIINQHPDQKEFYFVDVGAGDFSWVDNVSKFLINNPNFPKNKKYHIIGLIGEGKDKITNDAENIIVYKLGSFKIENIIESFAERGLNLNGKVDLIVSQWTLRHLADPLGTFIQMHQLTKPNGYMLLEGIPFLRLDKNNNYIYGNNIYDFDLNAQHLLQDLNQLYLMCATNVDGERGLRDIMIQKNAVDSHKKIGLSYASDILDRGDNARNAGQYMTKFLSEYSPKLQTRLIRTSRPLEFFNGHKILYDMLKENDLILCGEEATKFGYFDPETFSRLDFIPDFIITSDTNHPGEEL